MYGGGNVLVVGQSRRGWTTGLFDCCGMGAGLCATAFFCPCVQLGVNAGMQGRDCMCTALSCCCLSSLGGLIFWPSFLCCLGFWGGQERSITRMNLGIIEDSDDFFIHCCCHPCALAQEAQELIKAGLPNRPGVVMVNANGVVQGNLQ